jgi:predicted lactoylglutathione lyase
MSDDTFNMSLRKFLKTVGVTSQQEIEEAVRKARAAGTLPAGPLTARAVITLEGLGMTHEVSGQISTQQDD